MEVIDPEENTLIASSQSNEQIASDPLLGQEPALNKFRLYVRPPIPGCYSDWPGYGWPNGQAVTQQRLASRVFLVNTPDRDATGKKITHSHLLIRVRGFVTTRTDLDQLPVLIRTKKSNPVGVTVTLMKKPDTDIYEAKVDLSSTNLINPHPGSVTLTTSACSAIANTLGDVAMTEMRRFGSKQLGLACDANVLP